MNRRHFVAAAATVAAVGRSSSSALAAEGGKPVRETPLHADYFGTQYYDDKERAQITEVLETRRPFRWYGPGQQPPMKVLTFEKEWAARMQTRYALAVTSGTAALNCAMAALQIGPGDEVIIPAWTWHSSFNAVVLAGALPVFAEIDTSFNIDPKDFERKITPHTKAVMAVHLQGNPADLDGVLKIARKHKIKVLEDAAQSVGGGYKGKPLGSWGDIAIYSLQLSKTITSGEGGVVVTSDPVLFERAARFHDLGSLRDPHKQMLGSTQVDTFIGNQFRMNEFTGGVLLAQLRKLDMIVGAVRAHGHRVYDGIRDLPGIELRRRPDPAGEIGSWAFIGFKDQPQRDRFIKAMKAENVPASPPGGSVNLPIWPAIEKKVTVHPAWPSFTSERGRSIQYGAACCPRTTEILGRFAGVGLDPKFSKRDADDIVAAIRKVYPAVVKG